MENNNYDDLKDDNSISNKQEYELENQKADKLTNISNTLIFTIPIIIWFLCLICPVFMYGKVMIFLIKFITPISCIIGITLLIYTRIKYSDNLKSKKLVKTCIFAAIVIAILYAILFATCINILQNCNMPG